jgi:hypothetical protein
MKKEEKVKAEKEEKAKAEERKVGDIRLGLAYDVEIMDKDGKLISRCKGKSDPFTTWFITMLRNFFYGDSSMADQTVALYETGGTSKDFYLKTVAGKGHVAIAGNAGAGVDTYGIQVGTSNTAFNKNQYALQAKIAHGTGGGQLQYLASSVETVTAEDSTERFRVVRGFTNGSGSTITVKEIGLVIANQKEGLTLYNFLMARDVLTSPQDVPDGSTLTVRYRIYISYA